MELVKRPVDAGELLEGNKVGMECEDSPSPVVPRRTMPKPALAHRTTCFPRFSWSTGFPSVSRNGVVRGTAGPFCQS